jgi:hypothetical protein
MIDDMSRQAATSRDEQRAGSTGPEYDYSLSIEDAAERYAHAGHPRTLRTVQRYCVAGHLDCRRVATTYGDKFFVAPYSVSRHIAQIHEIASIDPAATGRDQPRPAAASGDNVAHANAEQNSASGASTAATAEPRQVSTRRDQPRPVATSGDTNADNNQPVAATFFDDARVYDHPYVIRLERQIDKLEQKLDDQVRRTEQIQTASQERLLELQRMTAVGQSQTLANFMLKAREWFSGSSKDDKTDDNGTGIPPGDAAA